MVELQLTQAEAEMLREILSIYCAELRTEIAHTDSREFRRPLREREEFLSRLAARLDMVPA
jgi:hypothetical protein